MSMLVFTLAHFRPIKFFGSTCVLCVSSPYLLYATCTIATSLHDGTIECVIVFLGRYRIWTWIAQIRALRAQFLLLYFEFTHVSKCAHTWKTIDDEDDDDDANGWRQGRPKENGWKNIDERKKKEADFSCVNLCCALEARRCCLFRVRYHCYY